MPTGVAEVSVDREKQELQVFSKLTSCSSVPPAIHIVGAVVVIFIRNEDDNISDGGSADWSTSPADQPGQSGIRCIPASLSVLPAPACLPQVLPLHEEGRVMADSHSISLGRMRKEESDSSSFTVLKRPPDQTIQNENGSYKQNQRVMVTQNAENIGSFPLQQQSSVQFGMSTDVMGTNGRDVTAPRQTCNIREENGSESTGLSGDKEEDTSPNLDIVKLEPLSPDSMDVSETESHQKKTGEETSHDANFCSSMILQIRNDHMDSGDENFEVVTHMNVENSTNNDCHLGDEEESCELDSTSGQILSIAPDQMDGRAVAKRRHCAGRVRTGTPCFPRPAAHDRPRFHHLTCAICQSTIQSYAELLHHISEHQHLSPRPLCPVCYESFLDQVSLHSHAASHLPKPAMKCPICQVQSSHVDNLRRHFQNSHPGQQVSLRHYLHRLALRSRSRLLFKSTRSTNLLPGPSAAHPTNATVTVDADANAVQNSSSAEKTPTAQSRVVPASTEIPSYSEQPDSRKEVSCKEDSCPVTRLASSSYLSDQDSRVWESEAEETQKTSRHSPSNSTREYCRETFVIDLDSGPEDDSCKGHDIMPPNILELSVMPSQPGSQGIMQDAVDRDGKVHGTCQRTIVNGKVQELYICNYCSQPFTRYGNFRRHLKSKHPQALGYTAKEADQKFTCPVCLHDYNRSDNLKYHVRKKHPDSYDLVFNFMTMNTAQEMPDSVSSDSLRSQHTIPSWPLVPWDSQSHVSEKSQDKFVKRSKNNSILQDSLEPDKEARCNETQTSQSWFCRVPQAVGESMETSFRQDLPAKTEDQASGPILCNLLRTGAANHSQLSSTSMTSREPPCDDPINTPFSLPHPTGPSMSNSLAGRYSEVVAVASSQPVFPTHEQCQSTNQAVSLRNEQENTDLSMSLHQEQMASSLISGPQHLSNFSCGTARDASHIAEASSHGPSTSQVLKAQRGKPSLVSENAGGKHRDPSQCSACKDTINSREQFVHHIRIHSMDVGDNVCPICLTSFSSYFNLLRHAARHLGTSPYTCPVCSHSINRLDNFKMHLKNHTDIPHEIQNEQKSFDSNSN